MPLPITFPATRTSSSHFVLAFVFWGSLWISGHPWKYQDMAQLSQQLQHQLRCLRVPLWGNRWREVCMTATPLEKSSQQLQLHSLILPFFSLFVFTYKAINYIKMVDSWGATYLPTNLSICLWCSWMACLNVLEDKWLVPNMWPLLV